MKANSVLVIGGGIAGLAAGLALARHRVSVTVIEAKDRLGGRIHTIRDQSVPVELGAEFVHGKNVPLLAAIQEAKLTIEPMAGGQRIFEHGRFQEIEQWDVMEKILNGLDIHKADCSFDDFLSEQKVAEPARSQARDFVMGFDAADPARISVHALKRAEYASQRMHGDEQFRIREGYAALVAHFAAELQNHGGRLVLNARARRIHWEPGTVKVLAEHNRRHKTFSADAAVVALPLGVLKTAVVRFEPSLPAKLEAARSLEMGNVVRIVFQFKEPAWEDFGFVRAPEEPLAAWWSDRRGPVLTGWAGGPKADALLDYAAEELETLGLKTLQKLFFGGEAIGRLRKKLVAAHYFNWTADPDIRGAYSYIPVNGLDLPRLLAEPVGGTLFFAGEATVSDAQTGTVFGALESGLRAAKEILAR